MCLSGAAGRGGRRGADPPGRGDAAANPSSVAALRTGKAARRLRGAADRLRVHRRLRLAEPGRSALDARGDRRGLLALHDRAAARLGVRRAAAASPLEVVTSRQRRRRQRTVSRLDLHAPRSPQRFVLGEHRLLQQLLARRDHRRAQASRAARAAAAARVSCSCAASAIHGSRQSRAARCARSRDLRAVHAGHDDQMRRRQQPHGPRQLLRDGGIVEIGEQHDECAVLEQRADAHCRGHRIGLRRLARSAARASCGSA